MTNRLFVAAKVTSAACILWSTAYLFTRTKIIERRNGQCHGGPDPMENRQAFLNSESPPETFTYPSTPLATSSWSLWDRTRTYLHHSWQWVMHAFPGRRSVTTEVLTPSLSKPVIANEDFTFFLNLLSDLAVESDVAPVVRSMLLKKNHFGLWGGRNSPSKMLDSIMSALVCFSKQDKFVDRLLTHSEFPNLVNWLADSVVRSIPSGTTSHMYLASPSKMSDKSLASNDSFAIQLPTNDWPSRTASSSELTPTTSTVQPVDPHPEYPLHLQMAHVLANLSRHPGSVKLIDIPGVSTLLSLWSHSPSLHLTLLCQKIQHNLSAHSTLVTPPESSSGSKQPIYFPDIYRLDVEQSEDANYDFDIIFVHGMRGSVFFTWRQNDAPEGSNELGPAMYSKCWPRDWLSKEFPRARILAINASLNAFIWDRVCPVDKLERAMDNRAKRILPQLKIAGVGQRPIIWITHSAGGILVKELLRLSDSSSNLLSSSTNFHTDVKLFTDSNFPTKPDRQLNFESPSVTWFCDPEESQSQDLLTGEFSLTNASGQSHLSKSLSKPASHPGLQKEHSPKETNDYGLTSHTQGVIFMSAPHRGNRSLYALYRRPVRWTLTPEAIQLERDSSFLLDLHDWFHAYAQKSNVKVLSMVETQVTPINRFWSVLLVPGDEKDSEMGEVVHVDSDHMFISKPRTPRDASYQHVVKFVQDICGETEPELPKPDQSPNT